MVWREKEGVGSWMMWRMRWRIVGWAEDEVFIYSRRSRRRRRRTKEMSCLSLRSRRRRTGSDLMNNQVLTDLINLNRGPNSRRA